MRRRVGWWQSLWESALAWVVALYPAEFRARLGTDLVNTFATEWERKRKQRGRWSAAWFGTATLAAALYGVAAERMLRPSRTSSGGDGGMMTFEELRADLVPFFRQLRRKPGFGVVVVFTLALGIGATTAVFSVVRGVLLRPLPYPDSGQLVYVTGGGASSLPNLRDLDDRLRSMDTMAGLFVPQAATLTGAGDPTQLSLTFASSGFFTMLALEPVIGRWLGPEDEGTLRVVLSHRLWQTRFSADAGVVGRSITLDGSPFEVLGVAPPEIAAPFDVDVWAALPWAAGQGPRASRSWRAAEVYGRLADGWTVDEARVELTTEWERLKSEYPEVNDRWNAGLTTVRSQITDDEEVPMKILFWASVLFLCIACANVATVFLGRLDTRRHEFAVRSALGAGPWRLLRQAWGESLAVSVMGGVLGVALAALVVDGSLAYFGPTVSRAEDVYVDGTVLGFALFVTLLAAVVVGTATILARGREEAASAIRSTSLSVVRRAGVLRRSLVVGEVALALMMMVGLGLLVRSFQQVQRVDLGVRTEGVLTASLGQFPSSRYPDANSRRAFLQEFTERVEGIPGVESVAVASRLPLGGCCANQAWHRADDPEREERFVEMRWVTPSYFDVLGVSLRTGRSFAQDGPGDVPVAIINQELARRLFGEENPLGSVVTDGANWEVRIVGVAQSVREYSAERGPPPMVYLSALQSSLSSMTLLLRSGQPAGQVLPAVRAALQEVDPLLPLEDVRPLTDVAAEFTANRRATTLMMSILGVLALVLGSVGIYGVTSHAVQGQLREIGVRLALGASRDTVRRDVLKSAIALVVPGVALGSLGAVAARRLVESLLYEVSLLDPVVYGIVPLVFLAVALLAAIGPAHRASRVQAVEMLRDG